MAKSGDRPVNAAPRQIASRGFAFCAKLSISLPHEGNQFWADAKGIDAPYPTPVHGAMFTSAATRIGLGAVAFHPTREDGGRVRFTNAARATAEVIFEGTNVRWLGYRYDDAGRGEVRIDGKAVAVVDQYGPGRDLPFDWHVDGLAPGKHVLRITLLADKNAASGDRYLNVAGFEVRQEGLRPQPKTR